MNALADWSSFYAIVGSAAGTLIGLQFVVMTLVAANPPATAREGSAAFSTPTIVHFGVSLLLAAGSHVPWPNPVCLSRFWGVVGVTGMVYTLVVARRIRRLPVYRPDLEDWTFHAALPLACYAALAAAMPAASAHVQEALFAVGGATLLLLFVGIHNAWDAVVHHVVVSRLAGTRGREAAAASANEAADAPAGKR